MRNGGSLTTIDFRTFPRAHLNTILMRITSDGTIVGCYHDEGIDSGPQDSMHGITIDRSGAQTAIDDEVRGVQFGGGMHTGTTASGMKKVGFWWDHSIDRSRGYEIEKGKFVPFDVPGGRYTQAWDVAASGDVVGFYGAGDVVADPTLHARGFLKTGDSFQSIVYPKSIDTRAFGINPAGDIVGTYQTADGHTHGFVALHVSGLSGEGSAAALKLPAGMRTGTMIAALTPIDKSAPLAKSAEEDPACHRVPMKAPPVAAVAPRVMDSHGF
jgi:hypothetical protein